MRAATNDHRHVFFTRLILAIALPMMGQVPAIVPKVVPATGAAENPTEPTMHLHIRSFFVDPYQFHEVVPPKLPVSEEDNLDATEVFKALCQWFAQLGLDMNPTNGKSMFWHDDGRLHVRASSADLATIEAAITAMGKDYSGKPHPRLEIRVIHLVPDPFEEGLRKLRLLSSEAATNSLAEVRAAVFLRFAELGVNLARPKTFHYDRSRGYLAVCAPRADLEIVEPEVARLQ